MIRRPIQPQTAARVLALACLALGLMCAGLAYAWRQEHERALCWQAAALYRLETEQPVCS